MPGPPKSFVFPNIDQHAIPSSSDEVDAPEFAHNAIDVHANGDHDRIPSILGQHQNKILEHSHNKPNPYYSTVNDTNDLPIDATTSHSRKIDQHLYQEPHKHHLCQEARPLQGVQGTG